MTNRAIARNETILALMKRHKGNGVISELLSRGFVPDSVQSEYDELYLEKLSETAGKVDTDYDMSLFSNYFYLIDNKIVGSEKQGSGYINPVKTVGDVAMLDSMAGVENVDLSQFSQRQAGAGEPASSQGTTEKARPTAKAYKIEVPSPTDIAVLAGLSRSDKKHDAGHDSSHGELMTVEESVATYSPNITDAELRGHVYFKQKHGNPMFGWEKWFIGDNGAERGKYCVANKSFTLLNQQFEPVKLVPSGAVLGVKTKFVNEYAGDVYVVIKDERNSLYYANSKDFDEVSSYCTATQEDIDRVVMDRGLCFSDGEYVPVYLYTFGNIIEIKKRFYGSYDRESASYVGGDRDKIMQLYGNDIADWHESLIKTAAATIKSYDFGNPITSERPYLSKENPLSGIVLTSDNEKDKSGTGDFKNAINGSAVFTIDDTDKPDFTINEIDINCGVSIKGFYDNLDKSKKNQIKYNADNRVAVFTAYMIWFSEFVTNSMLNGTTKEDVIKLYFTRQASISDDEVGKSFKDSEGNIKDKSSKQIKSEKDEKKVMARIEGERLYSEFLATVLTVEDRNRLNFLFNEANNSQTKLDYDKIPVGFEANKNIGGGQFELNKAQTRAVSFMSVTGSGCLAYTVGIGKTFAAIHNLAALLKQGQVKRPLVVVPKQVYNNWIYEMFGFWTDGSEKSVSQFTGSTFKPGALTGTRYKLNKWYNLRNQYEQPNAMVDEYTITLITYQGLEKIGFSKALYDDLAREFYEVINSTPKEEAESESDARSNAKTDREQEKKKEAAKANIGKALRKTDIDIDVCGFDYMVIDEAHNFKNIFGSFAIPSQYADSWRIGAGTMSNRGLKAFVLCTYLQKKYSNAVNLLTATPFTNSPFEVYSMTSLVAYNYLRESNLNSVFNFLSMFIETSVEYTVDMNNEIELNTVIKSYKNKNILRDLLYRFFDYEDNPAIAGVSRPCKINMPNTNVSTYLPMSMTQLMAQERIREEAESYDPVLNRGAAGRALNWAKSNSFSPWASNIPDIEPYEDYEQLVNESPKMRYVIECIKSVKDWHEQRKQECSGQVIYSNRGKALFEDFKTAIIEECGFKRKIKYADDVVDEVEIITSATSDADVDRKELVKDAFNAGVVKVIIGTATIQEGINLQRRGTVLYNMDLDWNPTAFTQLEGRIHRQGNMFKFVRIVVPMVQGTLDSFINQKLGEKIERLRSIWDKTDGSNVTDYDDYIDPVEIKFNLITNVNQLAKMKIDMEKRKADKAVTIATDKLTALDKINESVRGFNDKREKGLKEVEASVAEANSMKSLIIRAMNDTIDMTGATKTKVEDLLVKIQESLDVYEEFKATNDYKLLDEFSRKITRKHSIEVKMKNGSMNRIEPNDWNYEAGARSLSKLTTYGFANMMAYYRAAKKNERNALRAYGLTMLDDLSNIRGQFADELNAAKNNAEYVISEENTKKILEYVTEEVEKRQAIIGDLGDRVEDFTKTNVLLSYPFVKEEADNCHIPTVEYSGGLQKIKEDLKVDEFLDIDDVSEKVTRKKLKKIQDFMNKGQLAFVSGAAFREYMDSINDLYKAIFEMPEIYGQENVTEMGDKMCYLHYFKGGSDYFVMEAPRKDLVDENSTIEGTVFGFACIGGIIEDSELGYFDINELKEDGFELDFYFEPKPLREAFPAKFRDLEAERLEVERIEQERLEQERLEQERLEAERVERERVEAESRRELTIEEIDGRIKYLSWLISKKKAGDPDKDLYEKRVKFLNWLKKSKQR